MTAATLPRGIRNHNPGNIRRTNTIWRGMVPDQSGDAEFVVFLEPLWGLRALGRVLRTYYDLYHCRSVATILRRYAPPTENKTDAYIAAVAKTLNVASDAELPRTSETWVRLMQAIVRHENGLGDVYSPALYQSAAALALD